MNSKRLKNLSAVLALLVIVAVLSSCNRGGVGCPYEMEAAQNIITSIIK